MAQASDLETIRENTFEHWQSAKTKILATFHHFRTQPPAVQSMLLSENSEKLTVIQNDKRFDYKSIIRQNQNFQANYQPKLLKDVYVEWFLLSILLHYDAQETAPPTLFFAAYFLWTVYNIDRAYESRQWHKPSLKIYEAAVQKTKEA